MLDEQSGVQKVDDLTENVRTCLCRPRRRRQMCLGPSERPSARADRSATRADRSMRRGERRGPHARPAGPAPCRHAEWGQ